MSGDGGTEIGADLDDLFAPRSGSDKGSELAAPGLPPKDPSPRDQSSTDSVGNDLKQHAWEMGRVVGTLAIDGLFLVAVVLMNFGVARVLGEFHLEGVDATVATCLQWILGTSTIGLVLIRVVADLVVATVRTIRQARQS